MWERKIDTESKIDRYRHIERKQRECAYVKQKESIYEREKVSVYKKSEKESV